MAAQHGTDYKITCIASVCQSVSVYVVTPTAAIRVGKNHDLKKSEKIRFFLI